MLVLHKTKTLINPELTFALTLFPLAKLLKETEERLSAGMHEEQTSSLHAKATAELQPLWSTTYSSVSTDKAFVPFVSKATLHEELVDDGSGFGVQVPLEMSTGWK